MSDQLLRAHEVMEYVYNVADVAYPVSIRDQMNRAYWLVQKANDLGFFGPNREEQYRKLLVCGAGAAGVTAALQALNLNVETVLIEKSNAPFLRQRLCRSRWIDPSQYDWPAPFWMSGTFPYPSSPHMPLPWNADRSNRLALGWRPRVNAARLNPLLTYRRDYVVGAPSPARNHAGDIVGVTATFRRGKAEDFGMILWCAGFGDERRSVPLNYKGFAFWETDSFERVNWGVPHQPTKLSAIVSGGGDGALQDVIRLATRKKSARDVYEALTRAGWAMPEDVRHELFTAEDQAQRALLWCTPRSIEEHKALQDLHNAYKTAVHYLIHVHHDGLKLRKIVVELLMADSHPIKYVHHCTHFSRCYSLNHFLVLLLAMAGENPRIDDQLGVDNVVGVAPHICGNNPPVCHGMEHDVSLHHQPLCYGPRGRQAGKETAHVVVIRHGIQPNPAFAGTPLDFARQVMPYHLP
jgi:hypothetical protein